MSRPIPVQPRARAPGTGSSSPLRGAATGSPSLPSMLHTIMAAGSPADQPTIGFAHKLATPLDDDMAVAATEQQQPRQQQQQAQAVSSSPPTQRGFAPPPPGAMPKHAPPPPPVSAASASAPPPTIDSAAAASNLAPPPLLQAAHPTPLDAATATSASADPVPPASPALSPKTTKLLRRIRRREDELEELSLENALLKEANRRANEERVVREQERRVEARKRAEEDAAYAERIAELEQRVRDLAPHEVDGVLHDPAECARTVSELRELLQLREEQLELINLDRFKLYEEIETWKVGMEKLASLQGAYPPTAFTQAGAASSAQPALQPSPQNDTLAADAQLPLLVRTVSDQKEDIESSRAPSNSGNVPPPITAMMSAANLSASPLAATSDGSDAQALATPLLRTPAPDSAAETPAESHDPVIEEIYENQQRHPFFGWHPTRFSFMRHPLSDETGTQSREFESVRLQPGWVWDSQWRIDRDEWIDQHAKDHLRSEQARGAGKTATATPDADSNADAADGSSTRSSLDAKLDRLRASIGLGSKDASSKAASTSDRVGTDADGWRYSIQFKLFAWHAEPGRLDTVRRRRWIRRRCWVGVEATEAMLQNAFAAIQATHGAAAEAAETPGAESASADAQGDPATASAASATKADAASLAELAAAYSSSDSDHSFSMFTSIAPPEVSGASQEGAGVRALAKLLQLGTGKSSAPVSPEPANTSASTTTEAATSSSSGSGDSSASASSAESSAASSSSSSSSTSTLSAVPTALAQLGSYLASTRLSGWVGRKPAAGDPSTAVAPATPAPATADAAAASATPNPAAVTASPSSSPCDSVSPPLPPAAAPSPVCSYCASASRTALQFVSPESSAVRPLCSYCLPHYRQALRHIVAEFHLSNPDPLPAAEIARRESRPALLPHTLCAYCDALDTFPVQLLHLAAPPSPLPSADAPSAGADESASSVDSTLLLPLAAAPSLPPAAVVLESHDAYRFCSAHLPAFLRLVQQFEPATMTATPPAAEETAVASGGEPQSAASSAQEGDSSVPEETKEAEQTAAEVRPATDADHDATATAVQADGANEADAAAATEEAAEPEAAADGSAASPATDSRAVADTSSSAADAPANADPAQV